MEESLGYFLLDAGVFLAFIITVIAVGIGMSRHEKDSEGYFLAGRGLSWWLIGFSLIAANISTEQFVGMSGQAANYLGLAIASYEWMAAITLVAVAFLFLPAFLKSGIYTIPEFLEYRFDHAARTIMSLLMMATYVLVTIAAVIYSGAKTVDVLFQTTQDAETAAAPQNAESTGAKASPAAEQGGTPAAVARAARHAKILGIPIDVTVASWAIGILAAVYVVAGGLKACAWADLLQGSALIVGGAIILALALVALGAADPAELAVHPKLADGAPAVDQLRDAGGAERFYQLNAGKLHMVLPASDAFVPWTALMIGLWIPNFYYWGLNQYIVQRTLGSRSLAEGQKGIVFAAGMKLMIPFIVVFPGIIAFNLFSADMKADATSGGNRATLEKLAAAKAAPGQHRVAFEFNDDFAGVHPDLAGQIVQFNSRVAGVRPAPLDGLDKVNDHLLGEIRAKNADRPADQRIEIQKKLIGYEYDSAFGLLIKKLVKPGLRGFVLAAILGAVISSLAAMLNAASTIFTMDLYRQYLHRGASQANLVAVGRIGVAVFTVIGCVIAPLLDNPAFGGIFTYIQEFQGFISPGILGVFIFGVFVKRAPRSCGVMGLVLSPVVYGILKLVAPDMAFLDRMAITFFGVLVVLGALTLVRPLAEPVRMPVQDKIALESSAGAKFWGLVVVAATLVLYAVFW
jgi:SSS family solute:Na+ symporter